MCTDILPDMCAVVLRAEPVALRMGVRISGRTLVLVLMLQLLAKCAAFDILAQAKKSLIKNLLNYLMTYNSESHIFTSMITFLIPE